MINHFNITSKKPTFDLNRPPLTFNRSSKAYLWGLVRELMENIQNKSDSPLKCLDAACHSLITRNMFPERAEYYGADISLSRLQIGIKECRPGDQLG